MDQSYDKYFIDTSVLPCCCAIANDNNKCFCGKSFVNGVCLNDHDNPRCYSCRKITYGYSRSRDFRYGDDIKCYHCGKDAILYSNYHRIIRLYDIFTTVFIFVLLFIIVISKLYFL